MSMILASSSRSITLPRYARGGLQQLIVPNHAKIYTLSGKLSVDFFNKRGGWRVTFDAITAADYANIRALYDDQFDNEEFLDLTDSDLGISAVSHFLNMPEERDLRWNKQAVVNLTITLEPENADS